MADFTSSLIVKLIDQVSGPARAVSAALRGVGRSVKGGDITMMDRVDAAMARNNARIQKFRSGMFDAVATAYMLKEALSRPINSAMELEKQLTELKNKSGLSADEITRLGQKMRAISRPTNQYTTDLLKGLDVLVGFGVEANTAAASMEQIGRTATATGASIEDLSKLGYAALSNLQVPVSDLAKSFDILDYAGKQGGFELKDMAQYFPELGAAAQAFGQKGTSAVADMGAALQIVRRGTGDAAQAANSLANVYQKARSPLTVKKFSEFGINIRKEIDKGVKKGKSPIEVLVEQTKRAQKKGAILEDLFQDKQVQEGMRPLLLYFEDYLKLRDEASKQTGVVDKDFANKMQTNTERMKAFGVAMDAVSISLGNALLPALTKFLTTITPIIDKIGAWIEKNPEIASSIVGVTTALVAFNIAAMSVGYTASILYSGVLLLAKGFVMLGEGVATVVGLSGGMMALAAALIAAAGAAYYYREQIGAAFGVSGDTAYAVLYPQIAALKALAVAGADAGRAIGEGVRNIDWSGVSSAVSTWVSSMMSGMQSGVAQIVAWEAGLGAQLVAALKSGLGSLWSIGYEWMMSLKDGIMAGVNAVMSAVAGVGSSIKNAIKGAVGGAAAPSGVRGGMGGAVPARASGGRVMAGQTAMVGEKGPEIVEFGQGARVHPTGSVGGGHTFSPTFNVSVTGGGNAGEIAEMVKRVLQDQVKEAFRGIYADAGMRYT